MMDCPMAFRAYLKHVFLASFKFGICAYGQNMMYPAMVVVFTAYHAMILGLFDKRFYIVNRPPFFRVSKIPVLSLPYLFAADIYMQPENLFFKEHCHPPFLCSPRSRKVRNLPIRGHQETRFSYSLLSPLPFSSPWSSFSLFLIRVPSCVRGYQVE